MANVPPFRKESALLDPVCDYLRSQGYRQQCPEVQFYEYRMDLYGYAPAKKKTTAVELKLHRWMRAFQQALIYQLCADFVYLALPMRAAERVDSLLLSRHGLGLIAVHPEPRCDVLLEALQSTVVISSYRDFYVRLMQEPVETANAAIAEAEETSETLADDARAGDRPISTPASLFNDNPEVFGWSPRLAHRSHKKQGD